jgi:tRNA A37 methylthiotransferase MiaB
VTRLELARQILAKTKSIHALLQTDDMERIAALFNERQDRISDYLELEQMGSEALPAQAEEEIQALMREGYKLNQQIHLHLQQKRQQLLQELTRGGQMREANNAYSSPYDSVCEPMFFDQKK